MVHKDIGNSRRMKIKKGDRAMRKNEELNKLSSYLLQNSSRVSHLPKRAVSRAN